MKDFRAIVKFLKKKTNNLKECSSEKSIEDVEEECSRLKKGSLRFNEKCFNVFQKSLQDTLILVHKQLLIGRSTLLTKKYEWVRIKQLLISLIYTNIYKYRYLLREDNFLKFIYGNLTPLL